MRNVQVIRYVYEALGRGDIAAVLSAFAPDIEWREAEGNPAQPDGSPWFGPEEVDAKLFREWYVVSSADTDDADAYRTEIAWPIRPPHGARA